MSDEPDVPDDLKTKEPAPEPASVDGVPQLPALVVVWCPHEPARLGEVLLIRERAREFVFGRGSEAANRLVLHRQRPGRTERMPPVTAEEISRDALVINQMAIGLAVRRGGQRALRVNGVEIDGYERVVSGDTIEVDRQIMFLVTKRPAEMPPLRFASVDTAFGEPDRYGMIGESPRAWELRDRLASAAQMPGHVFIHGESGTGKELAAGAIHRQSARASGMFVAHSAAAVPPGLLDAELFGHAKNYPNPTMGERTGLIGLADGGTLFLDEIGEMPPELHAHLLRVLDARGEYRRLGESHARQSNFRFVAATNRDRSTLKHDFLARLNVEVDLPSFRDRREDVPLIARARVLEIAQQAPAAAQYLRNVEGRLEPQLAAPLINYLVRLPYATNAREIVKVLMSSIAESTRDVLAMPQEARRSSALSSARVAAVVRVAPDKERIEHALTAADGNVSQAARDLGITRQALYRLMEKFAIKSQ